MEDRYANLAWFAAPVGGIDLPALERQTAKAPAAASSDREARRIILDFVAAPPKSSPGTWPRGGHPEQV